MRGILSLLVFLTLLYNGQAIASNTKPLSITAQSWIVADESGNIIQSQNIEQQRAIASITKLMTALVVLDANQKLDEQIGRYTRAETIQLALVHSDNKAADTLCQYYPNGRDACIKAMNIKAQLIGMHNTHYVEPTGLSVFNVSTATDLVKLVIVAKDYAEVIEAAHTPQVKIKMKKRWFFFNNTNPSIGKRHEFIVSKTGYIKQGLII